jgi:potassium/chloride transporter 4/5/6
LQSLTSAPRLLQAIAQDNIIPFLDPFAHIDSRGEPVRALGITIVIAEIAVLIGNLDFIAPILTMFFLMCYMFVNLACTLQSLLQTPNWRPRWKFYHWSFSLVGVFLCLFVMFISAWHIALFSMFIAGCFYKYIEYRGAEKEWGDGFRGLALSAARFSLLRLEDGPPHTKNWRPQILVFVSIDESNLSAAKDRKILTFASQLKAGKGLTMVGTVLEGEVRQRFPEVQAAKQSLRKLMNQEKVKGFADVLVSSSLPEGLCYFIQVSGLAGLKPNTVILGWPRNWKSGRKGTKNTRMFLETVRSVTSCRQHALLVPKGYESWPDSSDKMGGTIDVWWIVLDGGLLMLIPFLLRQHKTWKNTKLRIFTVAQLEDNSIQMKKDLAAWVYALRIEAEVEVVELQETDLSGYAYERTLRMEQRSEIMKHLNAESGNAGSSSEGASGASGILSPGDVTPAYPGRSGRRMSRTSIAIEQLLKETKGIKEAREALAAATTAAAVGSPSEVVKSTVVKYTTSTAAAAAAARKASTDSASSAGTGSEEKESGEMSSIKGSKNVIPVATVEVQAATPEPSPAKETASSRIRANVTPTAFAANLLTLKPDEANVRRMHTAVKLNQVIHDHSHASKLVVLNLPGLPKAITAETEHHYMEFIEALTEGLDRVLLIRGAGREVITIFS